MLWLCLSGECRVQPITTGILLSTFMSQLDSYTDKLMEVFGKTVGGATRCSIGLIMAAMDRGKWWSWVSYFDKKPNLTRPLYWICIFYQFLAIVILNTRCRHRWQLVTSRLWFICGCIPTANHWLYIVVPTFHVSNKYTSSNLTNYCTSRPNIFCAHVDIYSQ